MIRIAPRTIRSLERVVRDFPVVSLDVFDTAIVRCVARPEDVFQIVETEFVRKHPEAGAFEFACERIAAEARARETARTTSGLAEITLDEIYEHLVLPERWSRTAVKDLEIEVETCCSLPNPLFVDLVRSVSQDGRRVVFVSDMYLPEATIRDLLVRAGYAADLPIFVSSALPDSTKGNGRLFSEMIGAIGVDAGDVVHIGDNLASDVHSAARLGISSFHYPKCMDAVPTAILERSTTIGGSIVAGLVASRCRSSDGESDSVRFERAGYEVFGPAAFGFAEFIRTQALRDGVSTLYFLARDGQIIHSIYSMLLAAGRTGPDSRYILASRRAMNVASLTSLGDAEIEFMLGGLTPLSAASLLERIGVDPRVAEPHASACGIESLDRAIARPHVSVEMRSLLLAIEPEILAAAAHERDALRRYLADSGFLATEAPAVVDLGWHGTLQKSLESFAKDGRWQRPLRGYYLGTVSRAAQVLTDDSPSRAYLFEMGSPADRADVVSRGMALVELAHAADHGTLIRFRDEGGDVEPVLDDADMTEERRECADALQRGIRRFAVDALALRRRFDWLDFDSESTFEPLRRLIVAPTPWEARAFGELTHVGGFGATRVGKKIAEPPSLFTRIFDRRSRKRMRRDAYWKEGFDVRFANESTLRAMAVRCFARVRRPAGER